MLKDFGSGWQEAFSKRLETLIKIFPELRFNSVNRYKGMLRLDISAPNDDIQYVVDCVTYRIERESAKKCERCSKNGFRRLGDNRLPEEKCLCITCYAIELDEALANTKHP